MKKAAIYLPLLANDLKSNKSSDIIMNYSYNGYGIYIALQQKLITTPERKLALAEIKQLAFDLHLSVNELQPIIENYFDNDGTFFYSVELNERMIFFDEKYNKASEGGKKAASNLTDEQRKERAQKAASKRWNNDNANYMLTSKQEILTPFASDANNRIEKNRIEEKRKEENEPSVREASLLEKDNLEDSLNNNITSSVKEEKVLNKNIIPMITEKEVNEVLNKYNFTKYTNEVITKKYIEFVEKYTSIDYANYFDYHIAIISSVLAEQTPVNLISKDKIKHQISINEIDVNATIHQLLSNENELNKLKNFANHISTIIN